MHVRTVFDDTRDGKSFSDFLDARGVGEKIMRFIITETLHGYSQGVSILTYGAQLVGESRVNYAKRYTIEHNWVVNFIVCIAKSSLVNFWATLRKVSFASKDSRSYDPVDWVELYPPMALAPLDEEDQPSYAGSSSGISYAEAEPNRTCPKRFGFSGYGQSGSQSYADQPSRDYLWVSSGSSGNECEQ